MEALKNGVGGRYSVRGRYTVHKRYGRHSGCGRQCQQQCSRQCQRLCGRHGSVLAGTKARNRGNCRRILSSWQSSGTTIVHSIEEPLKRTHLLNSHVTLAEDGQSLELMTSSPTAYELFSREDDKAELVALIEERTGIHVNLIVTKLQDGEDFQNRFTDIRESR